MNKGLLSKGALIAVSAAVAISFAVSGATAQQTRRDAKMSAPPPAQPGFCTASVNAFKWGHMSWRTTGGQVVPTLAMCYDNFCPPAC